MGSGKAIVNANLEVALAVAEPPAKIICVDCSRNKTMAEMYILHFGEDTEPAMPDFGDGDSSASASASSDAIRSRLHGKQHAKNTMRCKVCHRLRSRINTVMKRSLTPMITGVLSSQRRSKNGWQQMPTVSDNNFRKT